MGDISLVAQVVVFRNTRAFDQLVKKYQSPVRRFFLNLTCGDNELSDDLAQDTFIKAYTNLASFKNLSNFSTWLYRIAYNVFYDYLRTRKETDSLETLRQQGISWIAAGKGRIDLPKAMEALSEHFGVKRLAIVGGGHICGGFLEAGLIDEVSIMVAPGIDGRKGQTAVFDGIADTGCNPFYLKLESVEQWPTDIVWLRYKMK